MKMHLRCNVNIFVNINLKNTAINLYMFSIFTDEITFYVKQKIGANHLFFLFFTEIQ